MNSEARLLIGASQLGWVTTLTQWISEHGGARLIGQALTSGDVTDTEFDVLVLDRWSSLLSRRLVEEVQRDGAAVIVLTQPGQKEDGHLDDLGVSLAMPLTASPEQIISRATEVTAVRRVNGYQRSGRSLPAKEKEPSRSGRLVALLGRSGVTELVVNLADTAARSGESVAVVDFDTVDPSVAQRLGLPLVPNLLTAVEHLRAAEFGDASTIRHGSGFRVVAGLANAREWDSLTSVEADDLAQALRDRFSLTVAPVDRMLEDLAPLSGLEGRFDVARRIVARADDIVVLGTPSPVGLVQTLASIADVRALTQVPIHVAVNRAPPGRFLPSEWAKELRRTFDPASLVFLPDDLRVGRAAWDGRVPAAGRYVKAVRRFAAQLVRARAA